MQRPTRILAACALCLFTVPPPLSAGDTPLRIGIPETFFHDMSAALIRESTDPFADVLREASGLRGEAVNGSVPLAVARQLSEDRLQLAVLHSFEYAWVRQEYPELQPLMIAVRSGQDKRTYILVRKDNTAAGFTDLKGKDLALPKRTKAHCRLYVERLCQGAGARSR